MNTSQQEQEKAKITYARIISCLKEHSNITLKKLCELLGAEGSVSRCGRAGTLTGRLLRDRFILRDETKQHPGWTLSVNEDKLWDSSLE